MPGACQFTFRLQISQDARAAANPVADFHLQSGTGVAQHIHARTKLDQAHTLAPLQPVAHLGMKHDSSRQQSSNLLEDHDLAVAFHADNILLVLLRGSLIHGVQELPTLIANFADYSRDRRAVHVHVEDTQENTDANLLLAVHRNEGSFCNFSIAWRYHCGRHIRNSSLRIAKEPEEEHSQQQRHDGPGRLSESTDERRSCDQSPRVKVAVTNHGSSPPL